AKLTGMDVANASMYDGSTGTAEAVLMARRLTRRNKVVLSGGLTAAVPVGPGDVVVASIDRLGTVELGCR
ncbi:MAG: hypothetical protein L0H64_14170, partial [Pseudonocardia sp.]|nr:hypothetical protein [Pseudonocardia sp.]